jgi:aspartyl protease family protein
MGVRTIGKLMTLAAWVGLVALLTLLFNDHLQRKQNPNAALQTSRQDGHSLVRLARNSAGHYVAPGHINGVPVVFLVDTGATDVAISERLADKLGAARLGSSQTVTANGRIRVWRTLFDEVRLGPIVQRSVRGVIMPNMSDRQVLLGMSFLRSLDLLQRDGELQLIERGRGLDK